MTGIDARTGADALPDDAAGWASFFSRFETVILVANSDAVDIEELQRTVADNALFVFFNKTYKVLSGSFDRPSLLVARSSAAGANIVYRREVETVVGPFDRRTFQGILNLRTGAGEAFSPASAFCGERVGFLDLAEAFHDVYPSGKVPSSGFALAVWLAMQRLSADIRLAGFSAKRSERWKLFQDHDWTFEQTAQRMLVRAGIIALVGRTDRESALLRFAARFPEIAGDRLALTAVEVLGERLAHTDAAVDRLLSLTRWQATIDRVVRRVKPKTRKERLAASASGEKTATGLAKDVAAD